jgi:hypothetical protein
VALKKDSRSNKIRCATTNRITLFTPQALNIKTTTSYRQPSKPCPRWPPNCRTMVTRAIQHHLRCLLLPLSSPRLSIWLIGQRNSLGGSTKSSEIGDDVLLASTQYAWMIGWVNAKCNNQPLSTSIRWVIETMGEGGDMTIKGVEGRRWMERTMRWKTQQ